MLSLSAPCTLTSCTFFSPDDLAQYCGAWSWRLNFFIIYLLTIFGGEESRPWDLQAWIVEGGISKGARSRLRGNSASRQSHPTSRDIEKSESANEELGHEQRLLIFAGKTRILVGKYPDSAGRHSRRARSRL